MTVPTALRSALLSALHEHPGLTRADLWRRMARVPAYERLAYGSLGFHLRHLEREGVVASERAGNGRRYYPKLLTTGDDLRAQALAGLHEGLVRVLLDRPGLTQRELRAALHPAPPRSTMGHWIAVLVAASLVEVRREGRTFRYEPTR